jgi:hypothetical protein
LPLAVQPDTKKHGCFLEDGFAAPEIIFYKIK